MRTCLFCIYHTTAWYSRRVSTASYLPFWINLCTLDVSSRQKWPRFSFVGCFCPRTTCPASLCVRSTVDHTLHPGPATLRSVPVRTVFYLPYIGGSTFSEYPRICARFRAVFTLLCWHVFIGQPKAHILVVAWLGTPSSLLHPHRSSCSS